MSGTPDRVEPHDVRGLARLVDRVGRRFRAAERDALAAFGLAPASFRLLDLLARLGPHAPGAVAAALGVRQPTVSGWIAELRGRGLVERTADPADGRRAALAVTEEGAVLHARAVAAVRRAQLRLVASLPPHLQADLVDALSRIAGAEGDDGPLPPPLFDEG